MRFNRREFLLFMGSAIGTAATPQLARSQSLPNIVAPTFPFTPVQGPLPLATGAKPIAEQIKQLAQYQAQDDLLLPPGYRYQIIGSWGDPIGDSRFGYNNDYLSFIETAPNQGYLAINFEYISGKPWLESYESVIGSALPIAAITAATQSKPINAHSLLDRAPLKQQIAQVCREALIDQGVGIIGIQRNAQGQWERTNSRADRRITGISGLTDGHYLNCTGPAQAIFQKRSGQGYIDGLGDKIIGTFANCAGGTTPWGTILTAEENYQSQVSDPVYADGTAFPPEHNPANITATSVTGQGNVFGLAGNKYGWMVEIDPANPDDYGTKHSWLGRYRHEAVGIRATAGQPIAAYSGCDRKGGHIYKFVSQGKVQDPQDKSNSQLFSEGMLYVAQFNPDGTGRWIALKPDTPVAPVRPSDNLGNQLQLPLRPQGGTQLTYKTLGDLYSGNAIEKQGAILIDAHYAANACGGTCTARPEDTEVAPDGSLYIAFTSGTVDAAGDSPDRRIFQGPQRTTQSKIQDQTQRETPYPHGFIMHLTETDNEPAAMTFTWNMFALGGDPAKGGAGFANPDNLLIDRASNIWVVTDMGAPKGYFGNDGLWFMPSQGRNRGKAHLFAIGPMECELTGPFMSGDQQTLFLSVQHPGGTNGMRQNSASETIELQIQTPNGKPFTQQRQIPIGSNFPNKQPNQPPKPSVVAIVRDDRRTIA
jgi:uncharacterized protein